MNPRQRGELIYYTFDSLQPLNHGVFTRAGGISPAPWQGLNVGGTVGDAVANVHHNHRLMYDALGLSGERACTVWQVHGADTVIVDGPVPNRRWIALADGMVTDRPGTPLVMRYADCTPILFYDPVNQVIGLAHAGWRGTVQGAGVSTLRAMQRAFGTDPAVVRVGIGPSIGPDRYQVGEEVVDAVQQHFGTLNGDMPDGPLVKRDPLDGTAYLNLWAANRLDLMRAGVAHIEVAGICTATRTDLFFSHRAERGQAGRFGVVMAL